MPEPLRVAVAGAGFVGRLHARSARLAGARLTGVAASTPERAKEAADELGFDRAYDTAEQLVTAPEVDVVHICTPNAIHESLALLALDAGKHVICEKPLTVSAESAASLATRARLSTCVTAVPFVYRYYPLVREARARVSRGDLGVLRLLHGTYQQDWLARDTDWNWRVDADQGGPSRAFADIGSHWCDLVEFVSGHRITRLVARTLTAHEHRVADEHRATFEGGRTDGVRRPVTTEDAALLLFETDRGAAGSVVVSQISPGRKNRLVIELAGADGSLGFDQEAPDTLWLGGVAESRSIASDRAVLTPDAARFATLPAGHPQGYADCFAAFVADVYAAIGGDPPDGLPSFDDGARAARITDAVLSSARTSSWLEVG
jgi:predicted dehydrogenase